METRQEELNKLLLNTSFRNWALNTNSRDIKKWESYLKNDIELTQLAAEAKNIVIQIELSDVKKQPEDFDSFKRLEEKLRNEEEKVFVVSDHNIKSHKIRFNYLIKIAAVLSFIIVFSGLLYFNTESNSEESKLSLTEIINKHTQNGQQLTITLPDGSKVKLNSNSSISYPRDFFHNRNVELDGEAFFTVVRDESNPFKVTTSEFATEVLGTSFNVMAYKNTKGKVSVSTGKVKVSPYGYDEDNKYKIIKKEEALIINNGNLESAEFNLDEILWKDGVLVFSNESIHTISAKIQRWFNVKVSINNENLIAGEFSGKYANESLEEILYGMGYALNFSFEMEGNEIIINGNK